MKNILKLSFMAMLVLAMSACDFNPTDWGPGGGGDGGGRGDGKDDTGGRTEVVQVRGGEGDVVKTPCDGVFMVQTINVDDSGNTVVVVNVRTEDGMKTIRLTKENPSFRLGGCEIHLKGVERIANQRTGETNLVAHFMIKKSAGDRKHDDRKHDDDRDDDRDEDDEDDDEDEDEDEDDDDDDDENERD